MDTNNYNSLLSVKYHVDLAYAAILTGNPDERIKAVQNLWYASHTLGLMLINLEREELDEEEKASPDQNDA